MKTHARHSPGFSLIELTVTLAVSALAVTLISAVMVTQNRSMQSQENVRIAQDASRAVLNMVEPALRRAGFGINPTLAFDFNVYPAKPCAGGAAVCPRDEINAPDKLVFYARNQRYTLSAPLSGNVWNYRGNAGGLQLSARAGDRFRKGQILYVICNGVQDTAFVTVNDNINVNADASITIPLDTSQSGQFFQQSRLSANGCYAAGAGSTTMVFTIDRFHFFVNSYPDGAGGQIPWLMLDRGLDENSDSRLDENDYLPVAEGIEDFQVSYLMNGGAGYTAPDANRDWLFGNAGTAVEQPNPGLAAPAIDAGMDDATRFNAHPANVRAVRVSFVARAPLPLDAARGSADPAPALENRAQSSLPATGRFRRLTFSSSVVVPNMESRRLTVF